MPDQPALRALQFHHHLPCRCGADRTDADVGSGRCAACRRKAGEYNSVEMRAAFDACDRSKGGATPRLAWVVERLPGHPIVWFTQPAAKEGGRPVLLVPLDV
jgi:hypothetical protein